MVKVNGQVALERGKKIRKDDKVEIDDQYHFVVV
jgi:ribosome-associated protein YbcJ (S4-like RNA binding protein)